MSRRVYIALFALLVELILVAASGNQWVTKYVADHEATSPLGDRFLVSIPSFPWRFSPHSGAGGSTLLIAQFAAILTLFVLTFLLIVIVLRGDVSFSGPFFVTLTAVVGSALIAQMVGTVIDFDYAGRSQHLGLGRVGYALFNSNDGYTIMFSLMCALICAMITGIVGAIFRARIVPEEEPAMFVPGLHSALAPPAPVALPVPDSGYGPPPGTYAPTEQFAPAQGYAPPVNLAPQAYGTASYAPGAFDPNRGYGVQEFAPPTQPQPTNVPAASTEQLPDPAQYAPPTAPAAQPVGAAGPQTTIFQEPPASVPDAAAVPPSVAAAVPPSVAAAVPPNVDVPPVPEAPEGDLDDLPSPPHRDETAN